MISLEEIERSQDHLKQLGPHLVIILAQTGIGMPSLGSLFTGVSIVCRLFGQSGIHEICIFKGTLAMTIIESDLEIRLALDTRILFLSLQPTDLIRDLGSISFKKRGLTIFSQ